MEVELAVPTSLVLRKPTQPKAAAQTLTDMKTHTANTHTTSTHMIAEAVEAIPPKQEPNETEGTYTQDRNEADGPSVITPQPQDAHTSPAIHTHTHISSKSVAQASEAHNDSTPSTGPSKTQVDPTHPTHALIDTPHTEKTDGNASVADTATKPPHPLAHSDKEARAPSDSYSEEFSSTSLHEEECVGACSSPLSPRAAAGDPYTLTHTPNNALAVSAVSTAITAEQITYAQDC